MNKNEIDFINMYKDAESFKNSSIFIKEYNEKHLDLSLSSPFATLSYFAVELYLKAFIKLENKDFPKSHELDVLYNSLDDSKRDLFEKNLPYIKNFMVVKRKAFEKWRYSYESKFLECSILEVLNILELFSNYGKTYFDILMEKINEKKC